jgi:amino acid permease
MSTRDAALAIVSTIIGGGIVGVPFSMMHTGIPVGICLHAFVAFTTMYSCTLYIKAKDLTPVPVESLYEISHQLLGRWSLYLISLMVIGVSSGLMMIYFIVFGDVFASLSSQIFFDFE